MDSYSFNNAKNVVGLIVHDFHSSANLMSQTQSVSKRLLTVFLGPLMSVIHFANAKLSLIRLASGIHLSNFSVLFIKMYRKSFLLIFGSKGSPESR